MPSLTDGEREVRAELERDARPSMDEAVAGWLGKPLDDIIEADRMRWLDDMRDAAEHEAEAHNFEADRIEHEATIYERWEQRWAGR